MPSARKRRRRQSEDPFAKVFDRFVDTVMDNPDVQDAIDVVKEFQDFFRQTKNAVEPDHETIHDTPPRSRKRAQQRQAPPPPRQPNVGELENKARYTLHFGPKEPLTKETVQLRRKKLAAVCHPDVGGSTEAMQAVNTAADFLLAIL